MSNNVEAAERWVDIGGEDEFPQGTKRCVTAEAVPIVVCHLDGALYAFEDVCPHAGLPLNQGTLAGKVITCPFHGYTFNVETGANTDFADDVPLSMVPVRRREGRIEARIESSE